MQINKNKKALIVIFAFIFILMFGCNMYTEKIADDFLYHFSYSTGERIDSVIDIFPSMKAHAETMNGRLVAHFFVQLFEMLPKWIFNIVNAGLFTGMIAFIYYIASDKKNNNTLLFSIFGALWVFTPAFGQVYLWLDGACNYMWPAFFGFIYLIPFIDDFVNNKPVKNIWLKIAIVIYAFPMGAFSENGSIAFIFMSVLLQIASAIVHKRKITWWGVASVITASVGFYTMISAPGTAKNKLGNWSFAFFKDNFIVILEKFRILEILLICFCVLLTIACLKKVRKERIWLAIIIFLGSLASNFSLIAASYYVERSMVFCTILLVAANAVLFQDVFHTEHKTLVCTSAAILALYTLFFVCIGVNDIYNTGSQMKSNVEYILACKEEGILDIKVPMFNVHTKYSATDDLFYLSTDDPNAWTNKSMAEYFEINSIVAYWK